MELHDPFLSAKPGYKPDVYWKRFSHKQPVFGLPGVHQSDGFPPHRSRYSIISIFFWGNVTNFRVIYRFYTVFHTYLPIRTVPSEDGRVGRRSPQEKAQQLAPGAEGQPFGRLYILERYHHLWRQYCAPEKWFDWLKSTVRFEFWYFFLLSGYLSAICPVIIGREFEFTFCHWFWVFV